MNTNPPSKRSTSLGALRFSIVLLLAASLAHSADAPLIQGTPLAPQEGAAAGGSLFEALSPEVTGVNVINPIDLKHPLRFLYHSGFGCGGVYVGDIDGDGLPDLLLLNGPGENKLFRNKGNFKFEDITAKAGVGGGDRWGVGGAIVDINNDGKLDIYICNYDAPNQLYINNGDGTFTESAKQYGLDIVDSSLVPAFCDYDGDGFVDMYLVTNRLHLPTGRPKEPPVEHDEKGQIKLDSEGKPIILEQFRRYFGLSQKGPKDWGMDTIGTVDHLYHNNGNGTFTDVTEKAGILTGDAGLGQGLSAVWWDFNNDGLPDLYIANDFQAGDHLYRNNGNGTFTDVIKEMIPHTTWFSMGCDFADLNNSGRFDFFVGDMSATNHYKQKTTMGAMGSQQFFLEHTEPRQYMRNALYINTGTSRFMEAAFAAGIANSDWTWSVKFGDLDNDGRIDLFVCNGMARNFNDSDIPFRNDMLIGRTEWEIYEKTEPRREKCMAFRNRGLLDFEDVSKKWGLDHLGMSYSAAYADLNRDGNLDLIVSHLDEPVTIYRNHASGHRVMFKLKGTKSNKEGWGAVVKVTTGGVTQMRMNTPQTGFLAQNEPVVHFGLGSAEKIDKVSIEWPGNAAGARRQEFTNLAADILYTITEPEGSPAPRSPIPEVNPLYTKLETDLLQHKEKRFNEIEFKLPGQSLLPNQLSQLGPGIAVADVNGDGLEDLFVAGPMTQASMLYLNRGNGKFELTKQPAFEADYVSESMGAVFFDARGTGVMDLYVSAGSNEAEPGNLVYRGRLYLNDGKGNFTKAPEGTLPDNRDSAGTAVAADFDRDGKVDLFVGGRSVPGAWPTTPNSHLLKNEGGKFVDVTDQVAPGLKTIGMVTAALWTDVDGDGWLDLMLAIEFDSVKYFHNENGKLIDRTKDSGLAPYSGWWNGIVGRDLNGDGRIDYVVTNFGLNNKYHASMEHPTMVYYGDVAGTGVKEIIEAEFEDETLFPVRGKSCSSRAMAPLKEKFQTFKDWASAPLEKIYDPPKLQNAFNLKATTLESGVFMNEGNGHFSYKPLPKLAQVFPAYGCVLQDIDGDGNADLYMVGNFFGPQVETGRMDGGLSLLLLGKGDGTFKEVWPAESGLVVPGDAKSLVTLDLNNDGAPDFIIGKNDEKPEIWLSNPAAQKNRMFTVRLQGNVGNPHAAGARVALKTADGKTQTAEIYAGSGYLSQSSNMLFFGLGKDGAASNVEVKWPNGKSTTHAVKAGEKSIVIKQE